MRASRRRRASEATGTRPTPTPAGGLVTALACAAGTVGCGGSAGDILALEVSGAPRPEPTRLSVTEDGRGSCRGDELEPIPSERLIEARELARELEGLVAEGARFDAAGSQRRTYVARTPAGTVRWSEGAPGLPESLPRAAQLAHELEDYLCE